MNSPYTLPPQDVIAANVRMALDEDIGSGDVTAQLIAAHSRSTGRVIARESAVLCGTAWFDEVFRQIDHTVHVNWQRHDGDRIAPDEVLCTVEGPSRALLSGERAALNLLQTLSGTATTASRWANAVSGLAVRILDTRKTLPGLRLAQKYAVTCGGCHNHRTGLYDAILIKENHITACGGITAAIEQARQRHSGLPLMVEVENMDQLREALDAGAPHLLLDNFTPEALREAVAVNAGRAELEASGSITLDNIRDYALTGVDYISTGALTKHLRAIDFSLRFETA